MIYKVGFDNEKYLNEQSKCILERVNQFENKLYLEFGGKLFTDFHASRVLPGFKPDVKVRLLHKLREKAEIIICVYAGDIERRKIRADYGITYDMDVLRLIDDLRGWDLDVNSVVITRYSEQPTAKIFKNKLERRGIKTYTHSFTKGYPTDVKTIVSDEGYGANPYIKTKKPLVIVTAPGPGSGKLATCLSQLYHEHKNGINAGYSKFETFPIWNLPLKHPVNIAYESATADLKDVNMIDSFHLEAYNESTVNYNRDIEVFPVLKRILEKITGTDSIYKSPTDMGVNMAGYGIVDDDSVKEAAKQEIIRRYFKYYCEYKKGYVELDTAQRAELIMEELELTPFDRSVVAPAREALKVLRDRDTKKIPILCGAAIELKNGKIITGKSSTLMSSTASVILNSIKELANIADEIHLLSPIILNSIIELKDKTLDSRNTSLNLEEILIALSISATTNHTSEMAMNKLSELHCCEMHTTSILPMSDEAILRKLGINVTCDSEFAGENVFFE
jgi:uncharacterized protein (UPF0371 family)